MKIANWGLGVGIHTGTGFQILLLGLPTFPFPTHSHTITAHWNFRTGNGDRTETGHSGNLHWLHCPEVKSKLQSRPLRSEPLPDPHSAPPVQALWSGSAGLFSANIFCVPPSLSFAHTKSLHGMHPAPHCLLSISITYILFKLCQVVNPTKVLRRGLSFSAGIFVVDATHFTLILSGRFIFNFSCVHTIRIMLAHSQQTFSWHCRGYRGNQDPAPIRTVVATLGHSFLVSVHCINEAMCCLGLIQSRKKNILVICPPWQAWHPRMIYIGEWSKPNASKEGCQVLFPFKSLFYKWTIYFCG